MKPFFLVLILLFIPELSMSECVRVRIVVIRHGHGDHILKQTRNSRMTSPKMHLTQRGFYEIKNAAKALSEEGINLENIEVVLSSPLPRTKETAAVLLHFLNYTNLETEVESTLQRLEIPLEINQLEEINEYESENAERIQESNKIIERDFGEAEGLPYVSESSPPTGETFAHVKARTLDLLNDLKVQYCENRNLRDKVILLSTHDVVANSIIEDFTGQEILIKPGEFRIFDFPKL